MDFLEQMDIFCYQLGKAIKLSVWVFALLVVFWVISRIMAALPQP